MIENANAVNWPGLAIRNTATTGSYTSILDNAMPLVFMIAGIVAFIYIVYSGFIFITAAGNPDATKKGTQGIVNGIIGLVIVFSAYGIVFVIVNFLNTRAR